MDFGLSFHLGAVTVLFILIVSLVRYSKSILAVRDRVSSATIKALIFFALAGSTLSVIAFTSTLTEGTIGVRLWIVFFFVFLINAQMQIVTENRYAHYGTYAVAGVATIWSVFVALGSPTEISPVLSLALYVTFSVALLLSIWLLYDSPSPFTAGMLIILLSFLGSWFSIITGLIFTDQQYFMIVLLPAVVSASILATMLQPWRHIITTFTLLMAVVVAVSIIPVAFIAGQFEIWSFVALSSFVALAAISSIDFFVEQALETKARIPSLIAITLICISMIAVNHGVFWATLIDTGVQDEPLIFVEWALGVLGGSSFVLAGVFSTVSPSIQRVARHFMVAFSGAMIVLGHEYVRMNRWVYNDLFVILAGALTIGIIAYIRVAVRLRRLGSKRASRNFIAFMFAALGASIVAIASDNLPLPLSLTLLALTGIMLIFSSPRIIGRSGKDSKKE